MGLLFLTSPLLLIAVIGIKFTSPGPIFYKATRVGRGGSLFTMLKFRSMHVANPDSVRTVITAHEDARIFGLGAILRKTKIDELPQLVNVIRGDMSIVGPRPEDPKIVEKYYSNWMRETLTVLPGVTSPGSIFYYTDGEQLISEEDPEGSYVARLLPPKMAIERAYLERANWVSDLVCIGHTALAIGGIVIGRRVPLFTSDKEAALKWVDAAAFP